MLVRVVRPAVIQFWQVMADDSLRPVYRELMPGDILDAKPRGRGLLRVRGFGYGEWQADAFEVVSRVRLPSPN
jgi:hypothetical protein